MDNVTAMSDPTCTEVSALVSPNIRTSKEEMPKSTMQLCVCVHARVSGKHGACESPLHGAASTANKRVKDALFELPEVLIRPIFFELNLKVIVGKYQSDRVDWDSLCQHRHGW